MAASNAAYLERRLTLVAWFARKLGYASNAGMLASLKGAQDGWGTRYNYVLEAWLAQTASQEASAGFVALLQELDGEIRAMWNAINRGRGEPMQMKYFQYLAALASALFLRQLATDARGLLREVNEKPFYSRVEVEEIPDVAALNKLAFWMATGSGKTLLMHLHYKMFLRHAEAGGLFAPDNILLITPNAELSRQHVREMRQSGIPCFLHGERELLAGGGRAGAAVRVLEISKLTRPDGARGKSKGGASVSVQTFDGRNLVFVDEGHKGAGGKEWFEVRDMLVQRAGGDGFTFEYSATFGQALEANLLGRERLRDNQVQAHARAQEYARCILFDYSYRYFYGDGFGKDFSVLGIETDPANAAAERMLLLGNLLAFFQQMRTYEQHKDALRDFLLDKPLLLLLGRTVTGGKDDKGRSHVLKLLLFLRQVAADRLTFDGGADDGPWLDAAARELLAGRSGMGAGEDGAGEDLFARRFGLLQEAFGDGAGDVAGELRRALFGQAAAGELRLSALRNGRGEIALRVGEREPFALVYVGDVKKLCEAAQNEGMAVDEDVVRGSLFAEAHLSDSPLCMLIGAKKFMEGWSSWRVCGIGLIDIGRSEGTEIIQLFGRGVRLRGRGFSLKRGRGDAKAGASASAGEPKDAAERDKMMERLAALQTLNVFAIRAEFMTQFRTYLQAEGALAEPFTIKIWVDEKNARGEGAGLHTLRLPSGEEFDEVVMLTADERVTVTVDCATRAQALAMSGAGVAATTGGAAAAAAMAFPAEVVAAFNIDRLLYWLVKWKKERGRWNLFLCSEAIASILRERCKVRAETGFFEARDMAQWRRVERVAFEALCKYAERLYYRAQRKWEARSVQYVPLFGDDGQVAAEARGNFPDYEIRVPSDDEELVQEVRRLLANLKEREAMGKTRYSELYGISQFGDSDGKQLWRISFQNHLYVPLLLERLGVAMSPPGLTDSEERFVMAVQNFLYREQRELIGRVFLLRNQGRGRGVGFFEESGFYPDFMMWIRGADGGQRLVFVEPHGMRNAPAYKNDEKAQLWEKGLRALSDKLGRQWKNTTLDSYVVSATPYEKLRKNYDSGDWSLEKFAAHHILFEDDERMVARIVGEDEA